MSGSEDEGEKKKRGDTLKDLQKTHLDKLMANPDKPVYIPDRPEGWKPKEPPEFVRFYMGSSAGAGSEVFHVYRHLRRRENERQQCIHENAVKEDLEMEFQEKLAWNRIQANERTSKKRAKRLKKKQRQMAKKSSNTDKVTSKSDDDKKEDSANSEEEEAHFVIGGR